MPCNSAGAGQAQARANCVIAKMPTSAVDNCQLPIANLFAITTITIPSAPPEPTVT